MEILLSVCIGLGLSAACGFRLFVPFLAMSGAARSGMLDLAENFEWIASTPALIVLSVATGLEIAAYYVPWVDNLLDTIASPAAVIAGVLTTASVVTGMDPVLKWSLALIAGGGVAGLVQTATSGGRLLSTLSTAGFGNPIVATAELGSSAVMSVLAILAPLFAFVLVLLGCTWLGGRWIRGAVAAEQSPGSTTHPGGGAR